MSKRIEEIVAANPGIAAKGVVTMLIKEGFSKNENSAFNTLSRMKKANELIAGGKSGRELSLGPNAGVVPNSVGHNENGAAEAAPDAGRGATLPFENREA